MDGFIFQYFDYYSGKGSKMMNNQKIEDMQDNGPIFHFKIEQNYPLPASYSRIKDPKRHVNKIEIQMRSGRTGEYRKCHPITHNSEYFDSKSRRQINNRRRKNSSDDEYNVKNQKKDRNVTSNLIHHLMKYLTTIDTLKSTVQSLIQKRNLPLTFAEFEESLNFQSKSLKTYVTVKHIKELWFSQNPSKKHFCTLMRILSKNFLCKHCFLSIYFSNKFNRNSKFTHYKGLRTLLEVLNKKNFETLKLYNLNSNSEL